jgi:hypothetical protein
MKHKCGLQVPFSSLVANFFHLILVRCCDGVRFRDYVKKGRSNIFSIFGRKKPSDEAIKPYLERIAFLMDYLDEHVGKNKLECAIRLNDGLRLAIPSNLAEIDERIFLDPSNNCIGISMTCHDLDDPEKVTGFQICGYEEIANTLVIGSYHGGSAMDWGIDVESKARPLPPLSAALQQALWELPGWEVIELGNFRSLTRM